MKTQCRIQEVVDIECIDVQQAVLENIDTIIQDKPAIQRGHKNRHSQQDQKTRSKQEPNWRRNQQKPL